MSFHANRGRMIQDRDRLRSRANEWQLIGIDVERQAQFAIGSFDASNQKLGLQIK